MFIDSVYFTEEKIFQALNEVFLKIKDEVHKENCQYNNGNFDVKFAICEKIISRNPVCVNNPLRTFSSLSLKMQAVIIPNEKYKKGCAERFVTPQKVNFDHITKPFELYLSETFVFFCEDEKQISLTKYNECYEREMIKIFGESYKNYLKKLNIKLIDENEQEMVLQ